MSKYGKLVTSSETQAYDTYLNLKQNCQLCKLCHKETRVRLHCRGCETRFWILALAEHFGESVEL